MLLIKSEHYSDLEKKIIGVSFSTFLGGNYRQSEKQ